MEPRNGPSPWLAPLLTGIGLVIAIVWAYVQIRHWKEPDADYMAITFALVFTLLLWVCLVFAIILNWRDARRAKSLRSQIVTMQDGHKTTIDRLEAQQQAYLKELAELRSNNVLNPMSLPPKPPEPLPSITGYFFRVKIVKHGLINWNEQQWMMCGFSIQVTLSTSRSVQIKECKLVTHRNKPPCRPLSPIVAPQVSVLEANSGHTFEVSPQIEYLYDGRNAIPSSLDMVVIDEEFGAEHYIHLKDGEALPTLPT